MDVINLRDEADKIKELDKYFVIAKMNNYNFTLIKANNRKLEWHSHSETDEVFFVIEGKMKIEFREKTVELKSGEICIVPKGIEHRPIVETDVTGLLIEPDGTLTSENTGGAIKQFIEGENLKTRAETKRGYLPTDKQQGEVAIWQRRCGR